MKRTTVSALCLLLAGCAAVNTGVAGRTVELFYKNKPPSLKTLGLVESVLEGRGGLRIIKRDILDPASEPFRKKYGLPSTHFPFAVVIAGSFTAGIDGKTVDFVEFPLEMKGIGRHEGDWSMDQLRRVLDEPGLMRPLERNREWGGHSADGHEDCPGE